MTLATVANRVQAACAPAPPRTAAKAYGPRVAVGASGRWGLLGAGHTQRDVQWCLQLISRSSRGQHRARQPTSRRSARWHKLSSWPCVCCAGWGDLVWGAVGHAGVGSVVILPVAAVVGGGGLTERSRRGGTAGMTSLACWWSSRHTAALLWWHHS